MLSIDAIINNPSPTLQVIQYHTLPLIETCETVASTEFLKIHTPLKKKQQQHTLTYHPNYWTMTTMACLIPCKCEAFISLLLQSSLSTKIQHHMVTQHLDCWTIIMVVCLTPCKANSVYYCSPLSTNIQHHMVTQHLDCRTIIMVICLTPM